MNLKPIIKPVLNNLPFLYDLLKFGTKGTNNARYCYSVWLRHLVRIHEAGFEAPKVLAELGPGDSLGVGLAGMLSGVDRYFALDVKTYASAERNLAVFEELAGYFQNRTDIPHDEEFPDVYPKLASYDFPKNILADEAIERALRKERLSAIKELIMNQGDNKGLELAYMAPWLDEKVVKPSSVDMIIAQAVMEHVDDIESTYQSLSRWLKSGGLMSQDIDFKSHNTTWNWNGYYGVPDWLWRVIRGRREWGINRQPLSAHLTAMKRAGFEMITLEAVKKEGGISREKLTSRFQGLSEEDLSTSQAYVLARKV